MKNQWQYGSLSSIKTAIVSALPFPYKIKFYIVLTVLCFCLLPQIHALITGPFDTPYEGGFFYFLIRCPPDYPIRPPRVKLMTTGDGRVRFNPNLYRSGKVCLSIIG